MPQLQPTAPTTALPVAADALAPYGEDVNDFALGCECAEPALQIERWQQETATPALPAHWRSWWQQHSYRRCRHPRTWPGRGVP